jgi:hypothetical protein
MSAAAWVCDSCDTNNLAQAGVCRVCQRPPGSISGGMEPVTAEGIPAHQPTARPTFVPSKHSGPQHRFDPPAELPRITLTPPPARPPVPPPAPARPPRSSGGIRRTMIGLLVAGLVLVIVLLLVENLPKVMGSAPSNEPWVGSEAPVAAQASRSTPCPASVATWLPGGGGGGELVAGYTTEKHVVTICRDTSGQLYYDGLVKGTVANSQTHISLRASTTASGFVADNKGYVYEISGAQLIIRNNGSEIHRTALTRTGP